MESLKSFVVTYEWRRRSRQGPGRLLREDVGFQAPTMVECYRLAGIEALRRYPGQRPRVVACVEGGGRYGK